MNTENLNEVVELVVYKIKPEMNSVYVNSAIDKFRKLVMSFDGFISYEFYQGCRDSNMFMDYVRWSSVEFAEEAAKQVKILQKAPEYKEYIEAFDSLDIFNHFSHVKTWS
ncbi:antibiotic biosynthesis monooxygenase family protein [Colwellia sp. 12G3]|uniref:antibiotic biosynthesis monooxygenase family protein n=1 Tax=Colwellia sp. 12G3 TaxID=2058299 RepID=UPI000C3391F5|nr:hypothetical protein [Colwellia sp. 12G3]PKI16593.1 hypothetical protein CXF71_08300 [Colwellia sp. 12G3]